jgi:peptidyl-prolyl cis-trans isomerase A (cyclophilin A)
MNRWYSLLAAIPLILLACEDRVKEPAPRAVASAAAPSATAEAKPPPPAPSAAPVDPALLKPDEAKAKAPAKFKVKFVTTKGDFVIEATRSWAPLGVDRFYNLVKLGFFTDIGFFRVVPNFVVQFGIHGNPKVSKVWKNASIKDDKKSKHSNDKGTLTFAKNGPDTRTTQLFINYKDNPRLDEMGFPPIGKVTDGMDVVESINQEYREKPEQAMLEHSGNSYLRDIFTRLDYIKSATLVK